VNNITEKVEKWGSLGLLDGLPYYEKEQLSEIYDVATRVLLYKTEDNVDSDTMDILTDVFYPTLRRLYRRNGVNFDLETMVGRIIDEVRVKKDHLKTPPTPEGNPILTFCILFADTYEDNITNIKRLTNDEYAIEIIKVLTTLKDILTSPKLISYVNKEGEDISFKFSDAKKSSVETRFWNQKVGLQFLESQIKELNKGK